jgi:dTDP-4-dehydrorhamnose 3,5-epimerase/CDP-3, 6-dideoxy-D-glycero-D-glycero-4-hexulose-5-epimerase
MKKIETGFEGLVIIKSNVFEDERGLFLKTFNETIFKSLGLETNFKERYYSVSKRNVIRGMHFQTPPYDHVKLVNVIAGRILDVVVDLRENSKTYKQVFNVCLDAYKGEMLYIPSGFAHGFKSLDDDTIVEYFQTTEYAPNNDEGIHYNSIEFDWKCSFPIVSDRDSNFLDINTVGKIF